MPEGLTDIGISVFESKTLLLFRTPRADSASGSEALKGAGGAREHINARLRNFPGSYGVPHALILKRFFNTAGKATGIF